jgi:hypothetical protein
MTSLRKFEVRQANDFLEALVAHASDGVVEAYVSDLADMANLSRVQAQVGVRVLVESERIVVERRGRRATPGLFRIVSDTPVRWRPETGPAARVPAPKPHETKRPVLEDVEPAIPVELLRQENAALWRENAALRDRIAVLEARLEYNASSSNAGRKAVG